MVDFEGDPCRVRDAFLSIMTGRAKKNNTYKFALARFLLEHCKKADADSYVRYTEIAEAFFDYYWVQECKSRLRQGPPNQTPVVIKIINEEFCQRYYPQRLEQIKDREHEAVCRCIQKIAAKCFDDVIPRFEEDAERYFGKQRGEPSRVRVFYDYEAQEYHDSADNKRIYPDGGICLNPAAVEFLRNNYALLLRTVVLEWLRFLEKRNIGMPRLAEKIENYSLGPRDQARFRKYLVVFSDDVCFYCGMELEAGRGTHVDHFIPYDYVGDTDLWNLVLACQTCNCKKSGHLPPRRYIRKLNGRNEKYGPRHTKLRDSLRMLDGAPGIDWHYDNARRHGYPPWRGPRARGGKTGTLVRPRPPSEGS